MTTQVRWCAPLALALILSACSGKTERGIASETQPADQPAAGPAHVDPARPAVTPELARPRARHLLMVVELEPAARKARTLTARSVDMALPKRRGRPQPEAWRVDVLDAGGAVLYTAPLKNAAEVRGESPDAQGKLTGVTVQQSVTSVTLRLPLLKDAAGVRVVDASGASGETELGRVDYPQVAP